MHVLNLSRNVSIPPSKPTSRFAIVTGLSPEDALSENKTSQSVRFTNIFLDEVMLSATVVLSLASNVSLRHGDRSEDGEY